MISKRIAFADPYFSLHYTLPWKSSGFYSELRQPPAPTAWRCPGNCGVADWNREQTARFARHVGGFVSASSSTRSSAEQAPEARRRHPRRVTYVSEGRYYNEMSDLFGKLLYYGDYVQSSSGSIGHAAEFVHLKVGGSRSTPSAPRREHRQRLRRAGRDRLRARAPRHRHTAHPEGRAAVRLPHRPASAAASASTRWSSPASWPGLVQLLRGSPCAVLITPRDLKDLRCPMCLGELMAPQRARVRGCPAPPPCSPPLPGARQAAAPARKCQAAMAPLRIWQGRGVRRALRRLRVVLGREGRPEDARAATRSAARQAAFAVDERRPRRELAHGSPRPPTSTPAPTSASRRPRSRSPPACRSSTGCRATDSAG